MLGIENRRALRNSNNFEKETKNLRGLQETLGEDVYTEFEEFKVKEIRGGGKKLEELVEGGGGGTRWNFRRWER